MTRMFQHPSARLRAFGLRAAVLLLAGAALTACGKHDGAAKQGAMPPPEVGVVTVQPGVVAVTTDLPGRMEAIRVAQVRARVNGILLKRQFKEGSNVKAGQLLYQIDPAPYEAALASAQAQTAQAQAQFADASATAKRYQPLVQAHAVSPQQYDAAVAAAKSAQAQVAAGQAAVKVAQINLGYTKVTAPIAGHIGRSLVTEGALMSQSQATEMAVIQQTDTLYLNITQPASAVLQLREGLRAGSVQSAGGETARVDVVLDNGQTYPHAGKLLFTDITVDPTTGQVGLRAVVPNPDGMLLPGMYVRARLEQGQYDHAVLLLQQAVTRGGPQGDTVIVVHEDGTFEPRVVQVGPAQGNQWVILGGLKAGEQVMMDGFTKLMPGVKRVKPTPFRESVADKQNAAAADAASQAGGKAPQKPAAAQ